jgi:hypothetical protein
LVRQRLTSREHSPVRQYVRQDDVQVGEPAARRRQRAAIRSLAYSTSRGPQAITSSGSSGSQEEALDR